MGFPIMRKFCQGCGVEVTLDARELQDGRVYCSFRCAEYQADEDARYREDDDYYRLGLR